MLKRMTTVKMHSYVSINNITSDTNVWMIVYEKDRSTYRPPHVYNLPEKNVILVRMCTKAGRSYPLIGHKSRWFIICD